jgi:hypothetical protein
LLQYTDFDSFINYGEKVCYFILIYIFLSFFQNLADIYYLIYFEFFKIREIPNFDPKLNGEIYFKF